MHAQLLPTKQPNGGAAAKAQRTVHTTRTQCTRHEADATCNNLTPHGKPTVTQLVRMNLS